MARFGLAARAFVYVVIGWLAVDIVRGHGGSEADQRGALAEIAGHSAGVALLWALGAGFAAYAIWRLCEATFGTVADREKAGPRVRSFARGAVYAGFAVSTFAFIAGAAKQNEAQQQETLTARVMRHDLGRLAIVLAGLVVAGLGVAFVVDAVTARFDDHQQLDHVPEPIRAVVDVFGVIGNLARGVVFVLAGGLVVEAALTYDATKSAGLDGALRTLAEQPYGPVLLGAVAAGLIIFGIYGFAVARWAKI